ncbi:MAG: hypothetical protein IJ583_15365, partial [Firmicutes bacterium]|nr:hypothetical protein [Bacillota bacterium]
MIKLKKDIIKNDKSSVIDNIKNIDYTEKIRESKEEIQGSKVKKSQKENIKADPLSENVLKKDDTDNIPHISVRDYSGRIKHDKIKGNKNFAKINNDNTSNKIKNETQSDIEKSSDNAIPLSSNITYTSHSKKNNISKEENNISKQNHTFDYKNSAHNDIVKDKNNNDIIRSSKNVGSFNYRSTSGNEDIIKNSRQTDKNFMRSHYKRKDKKRYNKTKKVKSDIGKENNISISSENILTYGSDNTSYKYIENNKNDSVKSVSENVIIEDKRLEVDILPKNYESNLSYTGKDYLRARDHPPSDNQRSKFSELLHKKAVTNIKNNNVSSNNISDKNTEKKDICSDIVKKESMYNNTVKEEHTADEIVKEEKNHSDIINTDNNLILSEKKNITDKKSSSVKTVKKGTNVKGINVEKGIVSYGGNTIKNAVESQIDNSDDNGVKTLKGSTTAAITVAEIIMPDKITKGTKRRMNFNKDKTAQRIQDLGIKAEFRSQVKNTVLQANNSSKKALNASGKAILKSIRSGISEVGEDDLAFKSAD